MRINRALRTILLSIVIVLGSFTFLSAPIVGASESGQRTELYFTEYKTIISSILFAEEDFEEFDEFEDDDYYDFFDDGLFGEITPQMTMFRPVEEEVFVWPPSLFTSDIKLGDIPRFFLRSVSNLSESDIQNITDVINPHFLEFFIMWAIYNNPDIIKNFTQDDPFLESIIKRIDFELVNPFRINQDFKYTGKEAVELKGSIIFDLYLESYEKISQLGFLRKDYINVALSKTESILGFPVISNELKNVTVAIQPSGFLKRNSIIKQQIEMELSNESFLVNPGDTLRFSVELIPHNRTFTFLNFLHNQGYGGGNWLERRAEKLKNRFLPIRRNIGENISQFLDFIRGTLNETIGGDIEDVITLAELSDIIDGFMGSSFLFASSSYPSRVILPVDLTFDDNIKTFYLHEGNVMDERAPTTNNEKTSSITTEPVQWNTSAIPRNKIVKDATAALYINARNFRIRPGLIPIVTVSLVSGGIILANESIEITDRLLISKPTEPLMISFNDINKEIFYGDNIALRISSSELKILQQINLLYDSFDYPSSITIILNETDNIQLQYSANPEDEYIIPGGEITYNLTINSLYDDEIYLNITDSKRGEWSYSIIEDLPLIISAGETKQLTVVAKSLENTKNAYGDTLDLIFEVSGRTGYDKKIATVVVDPAAIEYDIGIIGQERSKEIKKGLSGTFYFIIENRNTAAVDDEDRYTLQAQSKNNWEIRFTDSTRTLETGERTSPTSIFVRVYVPRNTTLTSDIITFTATSNANPSISRSMNVTVIVKELSIFENIYDYFNSIAKRLGIDDMVGSNAAYVLMGGMALLILLAIVILIILLRKKYVDIICTNRIIEIDPSREAIFTILLYNPTRKTRMYKLSSEIKSDPLKWNVEPTVETISIAGRSKQEINVVVRPDESVNSDDWAEIVHHVAVVGKQKTQELTTMVMIKKGETLLRIKNVFTWPKVFQKGDRMITSFVVENKGTISSRNAEIVLFINGKQKNKVQVTIPPGGYADVKIPWIALKGKNELEIKINE
ncbi:MAG: hypothetical protein R6V50_04390 [Thermoplasmatota archaeon]